MNYPPPQYPPYTYQTGMPAKRRTSPVLIIVLVVVVVGFAGLVGFAVLAGGTETATEDWVPYTETSGAYTCKFPEQPRSKVETQTTPNGTSFQHYTSYVEDGRRAYMVMWADMPGDGIGDHNRSDVLDGAVDGAVRGGKSTLTRKQTIMVAGHEGREYWGDFQAGGKLHARIFLVNNRLYQMIIAYDSEFEPAASFFFDSFHLTGN